jgi:DNA polymerase-1
LGIRELSVAELNPPLNVTLVKDSAGLLLVQDFFKRVTLFGFDVETNVTEDFTQRKVRTIQVGNRDEQYVIDLLHFAGSTEALMLQGNYNAPEWSWEVVKILREGLESGKHTKAGVYLQFDIESVKWSFGLRPWKLYDCNLVEKVIYCGRIPFYQDDFWGMAPMLERYAGFKIDKTLQKSYDLESELTQEQIEYAALDTRVPLAIMSGQASTVAKAGLGRVVDLENNAIPAFADMHLNGFYLDSDEWLQNVEDNRKKHLENIKVLDTYFLPVVGPKTEPVVDLLVLETVWKNCKDKEQRAAYRKDYQAGRKLLSDWKKKAEGFEGEAAINYAAPAQVLAALRKMGYGVKKLPDTNDKTLKGLSKDPAIKALQDYRETAKASSSYGAEFLEKHVNPNTKRIHSKVNQIGAETGRTSSSKPNLQNILKGSKWRSAFKPRPGYVMVTVDMSGAELRIMAELSGEKSWLDAFDKNWDVHSMGAEMMYQDRWRAGADEGCPYVAAHQKCGCKAGHKSLRNNCKATNFKVAYGGADLSDDLGITKQESDDILRSHRTAFPDLWKYLEASGKYAEQNLCAHTFSGRRRLFEKPDWEKAKRIAMDRFKENGKDPMLITSRDIGRVYNSMFGAINRAGKNTPIQGGNIDVAKVAIGTGFDPSGNPYLWHRLETEFGAYLVNFVHDECVIEAKPENAEAVAEFVKDCIRRAGAEFMKKVVMESESNIADCWEKS